MQVEVSMAKSIRRALEASGLTADQVRNEPRLPNMYSIMRELGLDRTFYVAIQVGGSQAVHGTWSDLLANYVTYEGEGSFVPKADSGVPYASQYLGISFVVLTALSVYVRFLIEEGQCADDFSNGMLAIRDWFNGLYAELVPSDYRPLPI
jgi:hypothetical protein